MVVNNFLPPNFIFKIIIVFSFTGDFNLSIPKIQLKNRFHGRYLNNIYNQMSKKLNKAFSFVYSS